MQLRQHVGRGHAEVGATRRAALSVGVLFIAATVASVLGTGLSRPFVDDPDYLREVSAHAGLVSGGAPRARRGRGLRRHRHLAVSGPAGSGSAVAIGVTATGERTVLGAATGASEDHHFWTSFLRQLVKRGLKGVRLVISDAHEELRRLHRDGLGALPLEGSSID
jgi:Transposase, Mutator family